MASWDAVRECHVVRIVYDGPGLAGKTTNLRQITKLVSAKRRSEMYTPAELKGRTMFFDWLEVQGPPLTGSQIRFQLITVPGQFERNYRRRPLVEMADVVVFVGDCSEKQMPDTLRTFARLRASMKRRKQPVPLIVQANKQDVERALPPDQLKRKLKVAADVPVMPASAHEGRGVRETLAIAMRIGLGTLASDSAPLAAMFENPDALFDHVLTFEDHPKDDEPIDVEELYIGAEDVELDAEKVAGHLAAQSLDALEARARRGAATTAETDPGVESDPALVRKASNKTKKKTRSR